MVHRSPFDDPVKLIPLHPHRKATWQLAMTACDVQKHHPSLPWGFWCPDPATLLRGEPHRRRLFFWRWLHIRGQWLDHLDRSTLRISNPDLKPLRPQLWRDLLMATATNQEPREATNTSKRRQEQIDKLEGLFPIGTYLESDDTRTWRQRVLCKAGDILEHELSEMAWEMAEASFRVELLHLDFSLCSVEVGQRESEVERRRLAAAAFPDNSPVIPTIPTEHAGLMSEHVRVRAPYLEALRVMMARWRTCPDIIRLADPLLNHPSQHHIEDVESHMILYYVQSFWEMAGRAPQIPLRFPVLTPQ